MKRQRTLPSTQFSPVTDQISRLTRTSQTTLHNNTGTSNYCSSDQLNSTYTCYACLKKKNKEKSKDPSIKPRGRSKRLGVGKLDEISIKPWHPFIRYFQGYFKELDLSKLEKMDDNKLFFQYIEYFRRIRQSLLGSQLILEEIKGSSQLSEVVAQSLEQQMRQNLLTLQENNITQLEYYCSNKSPTDNLKTLIIQQQEQNLRNTVKNLQESLNIATGQIENPLKATIQQLIDLNNQNEKQSKDILSLRSINKLLKEEIEQLREENWLLHSHVRMDRSRLFIEMMKTIPKERIFETDFSIFEIYLKELEKKLSQFIQLTKIQESSASKMRDSRFKGLQYTQMDGDTCTDSFTVLNPEYRQTFGNYSRKLFDD